MAAGRNILQSAAGRPERKPALSRSAGGATSSFGAPAADIRFVVAQHFWGRGNLSPLDLQFGTQAVIRLVPTSGFGFIGLHLGQRLQKYADDMKAPVDAAEREPTLTRLYAKPKSSIRNVPCEFGQQIFKSNRYEALVAVQFSALGVPLDLFYRQCAASLKVQGKVFVADFMECQQGASRSFKYAGVAAPDGLQIHSWEEHLEVMKACGLLFESKCDMTAAVLTSIRSGIQESLAMLEEVRVSQEKERMDYQMAYLEQLEMWSALYSLADTGKVRVAGILAAKAG